MVASSTGLTRTAALPIRALEYKGLGESALGALTEGDPLRLRGLDSKDVSHLLGVRNSGVTQVLELRDASLCFLGVEDAPTGSHMLDPGDSSTLRGVRGERGDTSCGIGDTSSSVS